ncbi:MAG: nucleoside-diphosphate sugar epimerase/dehydratase [Oscillospiraceae bacterium]|nr:nucleoside-diphosphate sugar epimerase/dehydratase [Oscillospiraceae bacterium]
MKKKTEKMDFNGAYYLHMALFVLLDAVFINLSAFLALLIRHEFLYALLAREIYLEAIKVTAIPGTLAALCAFFVFHIYSVMWEFASDKELADVGIASVMAAALYMLAAMIMGYHLPRSFPFLFAMVLFLLVSASRMLFRAIVVKSSGLSVQGLKNRRKRKRTMLIGAGSGSSMAVKEFATSDNSNNNVVCIVDDDKSKHGRRVRGVKVIGGRECIADAVKKYDIEEIVFCIPSAPAHVRNELLEICSATGAKLKILPALAQLANGEVSVSRIRDVSIDDLLGRTQVLTDSAAVAEKVRGNTVLVTGGGGSIGSELCRQLAAMSPGRLVIFDIYENNAYDIQQELKRNYPELDLVVLIGSVRDERRIDYVFDTYRPAVVCHAAAHKHVPLMEDSPAEAIKNNIFGTYNVARAAGEYKTGLFILISTDKAVNPTNVMGATKRMCEMIVQSMNGRNSTKYIAVRFGNVLGSNGSVIPLFKKQIAEGGPLTVTDKRVTRFFMTIPEAVSLILQAGAYAKGGEVFVLDMGKPVRIDDMARKMIRLSGLEPDVDIKIEYTGLRPGEKLYEELLLKAEGLQKTDNDLIYIGHQAQYTPEEIQEKLDSLREVLYAPNREVRERVLSLIQEAEDDSYDPIINEDEEELTRV